VGDRARRSEPGKGLLKPLPGLWDRISFEASTETFQGIEQIAAGAVYRSTDRGDTWESLTAGLSSAAQALVVSGSNPEVVFVGTESGGVYEDTVGPRLTLDRMEYCVGDTWRLNVVDAPASASIRLVGVSNGVAWDWADWGMTDGTGYYGASGVFADGTQGTYLLSVDINGILSNTVSLSVSACNPHTGFTLFSHR